MNQKNLFLIFSPLPPQIFFESECNERFFCEDALGARSRARTWKTTLRPRGPHALSGQGYAFLVY